MAWGNDDQSWQDYQNYGHTAGYQTANQVQGAWNLFSNPIGFFGDLFQGNNPGGIQSGTLTSFSNPLGINFMGDSGAWDPELAKPENKAVFQSMTADDWKNFGRMGAADRKQFIAARKLSADSKAKMDKAAADQKAKEDAYQKWKDDTLKKMQDFGDKMNMSVDDLVKSGDIGMAANRNAAANASARQSVGLSGGMSNLNSQRAMTDAALKYQMGRAALGQQAYNNVQQGLQAQYMNEEDRRRYEQGVNLQMQQAQAAAQAQKYAQQQQQQSGMMGLAGGIIGGIYGGGQGAAAGSSIGQAYGAYSYGQQNPYQPYQYSYPSGGGYYGGGSQGGLSGAGGGYPKYGNSQ